MKPSNLSLRLLLAAGAAPLALSAFAMPAFAQTDAVSSEGAFGEIVVTAQRRDQSLQDVPLAITAVPPERMDQLSIRKVDQLEVVTPGLVFNSGYTYSQIYIRGVGASFPNPGLEPAVATYIDGSYTQRGFGALYEMVDVQTVQVLKGPQGTLYGRNASGGALLINSAEPTNDFGGSVMGEIGNIDHQLIDGVINVPISETLSARFAGRYRHDGGYVHNLYTGNKLGGNSAYVGRARLKWEPSADFKAIFTFQYNEAKGSTPPAAERLGMITVRDNLPAGFTQYNGAPIFTCSGCNATAFPDTRSPVSGFYYTDQNEPVINNREGTGGKSYYYNLQLEGNLGGVNIKSVTAFRNQDDFGISELDFTRAELFHYGQFSGSEAFTQDVVATVDFNDRISALFGASYLHDKGYFNLTFDSTDFRAVAAISPSGELPTGGNKIKTESWAVFGEVTVEPVDGLKLIAGGRFSKDKRKLNGYFNDTILTAFGLPEASYRHPGIKFNSFTPRFVISYDTGPVNLYASYNKGFKAGGYATPALFYPVDALIVRPEKIDSFEVGAKFVSNDRRLRANLAGFYYDYKDVQVQVIRLELGGSIVQNGAKARGKGVEFDFTYQPVDWLTLFGGATYMDNKYKNYVDAAGAGPTGDPLAPIFDSVVEDLSGHRMQRSPKFSGNIGFTAETPLGDGWKADLTGYLRYSSKYDIAPGAGGPLRTDYQPSMTTVNLSGNIGPEEDGFSIGFFVNNLTNKKYYTFRQSAGFFGAFDYVAPPRTYGLRGRFSW